MSATCTKRKLAGLCTGCGSSSLASKTMCDPCLIKSNTRAKASGKRLYAERKAAGLCVDCGDNTLATNGRVRCDFHADESALDNLRRYRTQTPVLKIETFMAYGGVSCATIGCAVVDIDVLTLDHINNNGAAHRKSLNMKNGGSGFYRKLQKDNYPPGYQVLCLNCNYKKYLNTIRNPEVSKCA